MSRHQQLIAASRLARRLWRLECVRRAHRLAAYWPSDGEISPLLFLRQAHRQGKRLYLPVIHPERRDLSFREWHPARTLRCNAFGIPEPSRYSAPCSLASLDVLFLPLVAFDARGHRLGMGGGFYDRTLANLDHPRPKLIGIAHELQHVERVETAPWDVRVDLVITERRIHGATKRRIC